MLFPLLRYHHTIWIRSYRFLPPVLVYASAILWVYTTVPNPVMESYAFTSALLFAVSAWLAFGFIDAEPAVQQAVTALHARSLLRAGAAKLLYLFLFNVPLACFAVAYPVVFDKLTRSPSAAEALYALAAHLSLALLGLSAAALFSSRFVPRLSTSFPGLLAVIALSLATEGLRGALPEGIGFAVWLLPPAGLVIRSINGYAQTGSGAALAAALVWASLYGTLLALLYLLLSRRKGL